MSTFNKDFSRQFVERSLWFIAKTVLKKGTKKTMPRKGGVIAKGSVGGIIAMVSFEDAKMQRGDVNVKHEGEGWKAMGFFDAVSSDGDVEFRDVTFQGAKKRFVHWVLMYKLGYDEDGPLSHPSDDNVEAA